MWSVGLNISTWLLSNCQVLLFAGKDGGREEEKQTLPKPQNFLLVQRSQMPPHQLQLHRGRLVRQLSLHGLQEDKMLLPPGSMLPNIGSAAPNQVSKHVLSHFR